MEDSAQVALAATVLPACKLIVGTFEESKFHAYAIVIKFGVEITTSVSGRAQKGEVEERKPKRGACFLCSWSVDKNGFGGPDESGPHTHSSATAIAMEAEVYMNMGRPGSAMNT